MNEVLLLVYQDFFTLPNSLCKNGIHKLVLLISTGLLLNEY